jgi:hypothetical protein
MKISTVMMEFFDWDQVVALCDLRIGGPVRVDTIGDDDVGFDVDVRVELCMPDGFTMALGGHVVALKPASIGGPIVPVVELTALTHTRARNLRALAAPVKDAAQRIAMAPRKPSAPPRRRASTPSSTSAVSELIRGNVRLRRQIEQLAKQMMPSDDD